MIGSVIFYLRFLLDAVPQIPADCRMSPQLNPLPIGPVLSVVYNVDGLEKKLKPSVIYLLLCFQMVWLIKFLLAKLLFNCFFSFLLFFKF